MSSSGTCEIRHFCNIRDIVSFHFPSYRFKNLIKMERGQQLLTEAAALAQGDNYVPEVEALLQKAVKSVPDLPDAWTALGHCLWKKGEIPAAKSCFETAIQKCVEGHTGNKKEALRALSVTLRHFEKDSPNAPAHISESIDKAKEAVMLDVSDCHSWYWLGAAYLARFFSGTPQAEDLRNALKAYKSAERNATAPVPGATPSPTSSSLLDLYINRGTVYRFLMNFDLALADYQHALRIEPNCAEAQNFLEQLREVVTQIQASLSKKPQYLSAKQWTTKIASFPAGSQAADALLPGANPAVRLGCIVMQSISSPTAVPQLLLCADRNRAPLLCALYNMTADAIPSGAVLDVADPLLQMVPIGDGKSVRCVRCENIDKVHVNGLPVPVGHRAIPVCTTTTS
ncbi:putative Tetratricopeptide repeat protein 5 [Paratrimastix pyriformis]|uniref:Tetratricopeptide repeat protein 5 n=1 Tax=Paratrimastix pyriformis TaxID=342808 RepID=A0ABQ8URR5_9EUKA|nr:putative Tetratricopeptide repeat protein 5 [Paratrimastix pyriformis]